MMGSNINIISNIYIRSHSELRKDRKYTEKITGPKRLQALQERYYGLDMIPMTEIQQKICTQSVTCANARSKERPYGPIIVDGVMKWVNRCEYKACSRYAACYSGNPPEPILREPAADEAAEEKDSLQKFIASLGIEIQDDTVIFKRDKNPVSKIEVEEQSVNYTKPTEQAASEIKESGSRYTEITEPDCIIESPLDAHIILNSGPGTGKTYTIIQRLIYILSNELCAAEEIYILCYTRSAKKVVESKIEDAVAQGRIQPSAKNICVLTFDSYATYFLMAMKEQGVITEDFAGYDYNDRIRLFNKHISAEDFENIRYFIVDEIQDLVNDRAQMVLHILENLKCGYLLAGDRCQSIYDFEADEDATLDSVRFYQMIEERFPEDIQRYEISVNRRQTQELAAEASGMRRSLLNDTFLEQNQYANEVMKKFSENIKIEAYIGGTMQTPSVSTAILCRSNGEAEYISGLLCERGIRHTLNRGVNNAGTLPRWIADVFWDYCRETISRNDFMERFHFRCRFTLEPEKAWEHFCRMTNTENPMMISMSRLTAALTMVNDIPDEFYEEAPLLTVSTIHKAKGSEFERVILLESPITPSDQSAEEARVRYVALTRPKSQLVTMRKNTRYFKRTLSGRVIETGLHSNRVYKTRYTYCKSITVGLTGDVDTTSFVSGDFEAVIALQEYIIQNIKLYDRLTAVYSPHAGTYEILHNGKCIGSLAKQMIQELNMGVSATDYKYNLPERLENLYVSGITTEVLRAFSSKVPIEFQKSRICFGIQITGLAKLTFERR